MRTGNPALRNFEKPQTWEELGARVDQPRAREDDGAVVHEASATMTVRGTAIKTGILLAICVAVAVPTFILLQPYAQHGFIMMLGALAPVLILSLVVTRSAKLAPYLAPPLAAFEGFLVGAFAIFIATLAVSRFGLEQALALRILGEAVTITFGILAIVLVAYSTGLIRLGDTAKKIIGIATVGLMAYYMIALVLSLVGIGGISMGWSFSPIGIGFSVLVVALASFNLVLDVQRVDEGVKAGAPKAMEWTAAAGLLITLVWLYIEVVRLLLKLYVLFNHE